MIFLISWSSDYYRPLQAFNTESLNTPELSPLEQSQGGLTGNWLADFYMP